MDRLDRSLATSLPGRCAPWLFLFLLLFTVAPGRAQEIPAAAPAAPFRPPAPTILSPEDKAAVESHTVALRVSLPRAAWRPGLRLRVLLDGQQVAEKEVAAPQGPQDGTAEGLVQSFSLGFQGESATITVLALTADAIGPPATAHLRYALPDLSALLIGISDYELGELRLPSADNDAAAVDRTLALQEGRRYKHVEDHLVLNDLADRAKILGELEWLRKSVGKRDVALLFLAGRSVSDPGSGAWTFLPFGSRRGGGPALTAQDLQRAVHAIPGKVVVFLDTSGTGDGAFTSEHPLPDVDVMARGLSEAGHVAVFTAATEQRPSGGAERLTGGAFGRAVMEALQGYGSGVRGQPVTLRLLAAYLQRRVPRLTQGRQVPGVTLDPALADLVLATSTLAPERRVAEKNGPGAARQGGSATQDPGPEALPPVKAGRAMFGLHFGPSFSVYPAVSSHFGLGLDLGYSLTSSGNLYLVVSPSFQFVDGWSFLLPVGLQGDIGLGVRGLYLTLRAQLGYAYAGTHGGVFVPEVGLKYVPRATGGRLSIGLVPASVPVQFFRPGDALGTVTVIGYRALLSIGVNFGPAPKE